MPETEEEKRREGAARHREVRLVPAGRQHLKDAVPIREDVLAALRKEPSSE